MVLNAFRSRITHDLFWVVLGTTFLFLTSCDPCKRLQKRCPVTEVKDSIVYRDSTVFKDTTIYVTVPDLEVLYDTEFILIPGEPLNIPKITKKDGNLTVWAEVKHNRLMFGGRFNDTIIKVDLANALKEVTYWKEKYHNEKIVVKEKYIPPFYKFTFWFFIVVSVIVATYLITKFVL